MRVELIKHYTTEDVESELRRLVDAYGGIESLSQKVSVTKCNNPKFQDELVLWRALQAPHVEVRTSVAFEGSEKVGNITPARMDLLEAIRRTRPHSVRELAMSVKRNYKNVYDDIQALCDVGLVELVVKGRKSRPICTADEIKFNLES
jgi:predicted transcriptional regulator